MQPYYKQLPGRLDETILTRCLVSVLNGDVIVSFVYAVDEILFSANYHNWDDTWTVVFDGIEYSVEMLREEIYGDCSGLYAVRKVLSHGVYKNPKRIAILEKYRRLLNVYPAKLLKLKNI